MLPDLIQSTTETILSNKASPSHTNHTTVYRALKMLYTFLLSQAFRTIINYFSFKFPSFHLIYFRLLLIAVLLPLFLLLLFLVVVKRPLAHYRHLPLYIRNIPLMLKSFFYPTFYNCSILNCVDLCYSLLYILPWLC